MMKLLLISSLVIFSACSSTPTKWPEDYGVSCATATDEDLENGTRTCLRSPSYTEQYKWHRVREWQELPGIPDLP